MVLSEDSSNKMKVRGGGSAMTRNKLIAMGPKKKKEGLTLSVKKAQQFAQEFRP